MKPKIPDLPHGCNSWIAIRRADGKVIGEFFNRHNVERFNPEKVEVMTTVDYLAAQNRRRSSQFLHDLFFFSIK